MNDLEKMAAALNASGYYHVLRHLDLCPIAEVPAGAALRTALYVDTETTGIDPKQHEIIELAMVPFRYETGSGRICHIGQAFQGYRQPKEPIPAQITALTGITGEMVAGKKIDPADLAPLIGEASIVIAHNAAFDRQFLELFCADFTAKPWACSMSQVDWAAQGYEGTKLAYLAMECGFFYDRHGALADCMAGIKLPFDRATEVRRLCHGRAPRASEAAELAHLGKGRTIRAEGCAKSEGLPLGWRGKSLAHRCHGGGKGRRTGLLALGRLPATNRYPYTQDQCH